MWALRKYKYLLEDARFTLRRNNKALTWLYKVRDKRGKLTRWAMYLMTFEFDVEHVPSKDNELSDALSRFLGNEEFHVDECIYDAMGPPRRRYNEEEVVVARERVLFHHHDDDLAGHTGVAETLRMIRREYYWSHLRHSV